MTFNDVEQLLARIRIERICGTWGTGSDTGAVKTGTTEREAYLGFRLGYLIRDLTSTFNPPRTHPRPYADELKKAQLGIKQMLQKYGEHIFSLSAKDIVRECVSSSLL
ncbi:hypothetical protein BT96DRAFT_1025804 [Gymnopus androsaceus JB14]|uniref:Uncharacterized protein n=1 Tax=Gymnopus androsaceus JB14 TaxID=1447944 RepID=A0A6A4GQT9_9AGAR|nr:hypothetical protein BT96DRAFT_1025804 [Gymnopus androsaceus JB14]